VVIMSSVVSKNGQCTIIGFIITSFTLAQHDMASRGLGKSLETEDHPRVHVISSR
jgi:hypothetical protein